MSHNLDYRCPIRAYRSSFYVYMLFVYMCGGTFTRINIIINYFVLQIYFSFSILSQILRYTPSISFPNKPAGLVRILPHFGHFCGVEYTIAIYSKSGALKVCPHCVHLNVVIPLSMVFTLYDYIIGITAQVHAGLCSFPWDG